LERLRPAEIIYPSKEEKPAAAVREDKVVLNPYEDWVFGPETAEFTLREHFKVASLDGFGLKGRPAAALDEAYEMFPRLRERRRNYGMQLSGGEQQMLSMARTLLGKPSILLLDEPLEGLAPVICDELMALLVRLAASNEVTIILVEQQIERALDFADSVMVLERGRISWAGKPEVLIADRVLVDRLVGVGIH